MYTTYRYIFLKMLGRGKTFSSAEPINPVIYKYVILQFVKVENWLIIKNIIIGKFCAIYI